MPRHESWKAQKRTPLATLCFRALYEAFQLGQKCGPFSGQASSYYSPLLEYEHAPKLAERIRNLLAAEAVATAGPDALTTE